MVKCVGEVMVRCDEGLSWCIKLCVRMMCVCVNEDRDMLQDELLWLWQKRIEDLKLIGVHGDVL